MASQEPFIASVDLWPVSWAPKGWALCDGALLSINQNSALYSLLGVAFGGDGQTTFGLPDLRGKVAVGAGVSKTGTSYPFASTGGVEQVTLQPSQGPLAAHTHPATYTDPNFTGTASGTVAPGANNGDRGVALSNTPVNNFPVALAAGTNNYATTANANMGVSNLSITVNVTKSSAGSVAVGQNAGMPASQPHENRMPYLALNYIIALEGTYPTRN
ncbi:MAG: tail fiber protein [Bacteroidetes bacterium]|nr:tail fiber protein [Bacteroidota bacterium]